MPLDFEQKQVVVDDLLLNYYFYIPENKSGKSLIFLHGWRSDSSVWSKILENEKFADFRIYLLDLPGFGKSQLKTSGFNLEKYAKTIKSFIDKLGIKKPIAIGHSFGGAVLIKLASLNDKLFNSLVLVSSAGIRRKTAKKTLLKAIAKLISPLFKPNFMQSFRLNIYRMIGSGDYVATPQLTETYLNIIKEDLSDEMKKINNKTLIIWGDSDKDTPKEDAFVMNSKIKKSTLKIIRDAGHLIIITDSEIVSKYIINFINDDF